jgi:hypothetical protein
MGEFKQRPSWSCEKKEALGVRCSWERELRGRTGKQNVYIKMRKVSERSQHTLPIADKYRRNSLAAFRLWCFNSSKV